MARNYFIGAMLLFVGLVVLSAGCDKQKIVESTEYIHDTKYVELPPDTVFRVDTVFHSDSVTVRKTDTVKVTQYVHDTVRVTQYVHDTVVTIRNYYDTVVVRDTVIKPQYTPDTSLAVSALQHYTNPAVLDFVNQQFGMTDGWIYYLASEQMDISRPSSNVYDIYGYLDFWAPDWSGYYPLEFYWRLTYKGGDPANPNNWDMSEPPASPKYRPGVTAATQTKMVRQLAR